MFFVCLFVCLTSFIAAQQTIRVLKRYQLEYAYIKKRTKTKLYKNNRIKLIKSHYTLRKLRKYQFSQLHVMASVANKRRLAKLDNLGYQWKLMFSNMAFLIEQLTDIARKFGENTPTVQGTSFGFVLMNFSIDWFPFHIVIQKWVT